MYVRRKQVKGQTYYQLVQGIREGSRVRQRVIASLGQSPTIEAAIGVLERRIRSEERTFKRLARHLENESCPQGFKDEAERVAQRVRQLRAERNRLRDLRRITPAGSAGHGPPRGTHAA